MGRPFWQIQIITAFWPLRNFLARMVNWPLLGSWLKAAFRGDQASFIPVKVELENPQSVPLPAAVVEKIILDSPYHFILDRCLCRSLSVCQNFPADIGCLFLGQGAKEIAPSLGHEVSPAEALAHHRRAVAIGLIPMVGRLKWDALWLGVQKGDKLLTICHCCHCCCYFSLYRHLPSEAKRGLQKLPGLEVRVNARCNGCGICAQKCFMGAITITNGKAIIGAECRGCGRCATFCPPKAIEITLPPLETIEKFLGKLVTT